MERFKVTMAQNSKTIPQWIEDTIEENIDAISYMSTLKDRIVEREEKLLKEIGYSENFNIKIVNSTDKTSREKYVKFLFKNCIEIMDCSKEIVTE